MKYYNLLIVGIMFCAIVNSNCSKECDSGTISLSSYLKKTASAGHGNDLPEEFSYSINEFIELIRGEWLSEDGQSSLELEIDTSMAASYNVATPHTLCGPTVCRIDIIGVYKKDVLEEQLTGIVSGYTHIDSGEVDLNIGENIYLFDFKKNLNGTYILVDNFRKLTSSFYTKQ